ncbi:hypothetical protein [Microbacterium phyllosphaerae]|uniref:hypothetical protein n=1 Tax=Microbacterium phyllosphaerae TaxID=124798 RepID=UPI002169B010|nr:hypothetical protein [Microbacterium phyllosphaerae]MCS3442206.1 hypothetical protein [Microbacterium phyllosphaerae]
MDIKRKASAMNTTLVTLALAATTITGGGIAHTVIDSAESENASTPQASVEVTAGQFSYQLAVTGGGFSDVTTFGTIDDGHGTGPVPAVDASNVHTLVPFVHGGLSTETGVGGFVVSGIAGSDVTAVTVALSDGRTATAELVDGVWAAVFNGYSNEVADVADIRFTTSDGQAHQTTSEAAFVDAE